MIIPLYVVGTGAGIVLMTAAIAWVYEKTRKRLEHPSLGQIIYSHGHWSGLRKHFSPDEPAIRFELPGDREGPEPEAVEKFEGLWSEMPSILDSIRPAATAEYADIKDTDDSKEHRELVAEIAQAMEFSSESFDKYWQLSEIALKEGQHSENEDGWLWCLEFEVAWDVEHTRSAHLNLNKELVEYNLSCAMLP